MIQNLENTSDNFRFAAAVAEFGLLLRILLLNRTQLYTSNRPCKKSKREDKEGYRKNLSNLYRP
jgi:hypothetical protein